MKRIRYLLFILLLIPNIIFGKMNYDDALKFASTYTSSLNDSYDKFFISGKDKFISINEFDVASSNGLSYLSSNGLDYWSNSVDGNSAYTIGNNVNIHSKNSTEHIRITEYTKSDVIVTSGLGTNNDPWILDSTIKKIIINSDNDAIGQINNGTFLTSSETINTEINNLNQYFQVNTGTTMCSNGGRITITDRTKVQVINSNKKDIMCTVKYEYRTMTVTYDANGGSVSPTSGIQRYNSTYTNLPTPTRDNYIFLGWYTDATDGDKVTTDTVVNRIDNHTLYAHWEIAYKLAFCYTGTFKVSVSVDVYNGSSYETKSAKTKLTNACIHTKNDEWTVWFLTSGTLTSDIDTEFNVFLVGGGAGGSRGCSYGGAGGYTTSSTSLITLAKSSSQTITIGSGGRKNGGSGGATTAFGLTANGGSGKDNGTGFGGSPASCGGFAEGGKAGQGVYAFGDSSIDGMMYGAGGAGGTCTDYTANVNNPVDSRSGQRADGRNGGGYTTYGAGGAGEANTGGGGAGGYYNGTAASDNMTHDGGAGGSGIVIIQSKKNISINGTNIASFSGGYDAFTSNGKTYIRLKSTGVLKMNTSLNVSAFLVGGGQAGYNGNSYGGAGGYTTTSTSTISLTNGTSYNITVGEGGRRNGAAGEATVAFGLTANGGSNRTSGTAAGGKPANCSSWTDGASGGNGVYAFGDSSVDRIMYGAGGAGGGCNGYTANPNNPVDSRTSSPGRTGGGSSTNPGTINTGGGGGGGYYCQTCSTDTASANSTGGAGGSGVVILRID